MNERDRTNDYDPNGLIREGYSIEGITLQDCRMILLEWSLSLPLDADVHAHLERCLEEYALEGHPMTSVLNEGLAKALPPQRRGGAKARRLNGT